MALIFRITLFFLLISVVEVWSVPTRIMIRAKAKDAKFIGTSMAGAYVKITDHLSGRLLADGYTNGETGSTDIIMRQPHARHGRLSNDGSAGYLATLDIERPVFITISVLGPMSDPQASVLASTQLWVIPGKHIEGDGVILEIPGFVVNVMDPQITQTVQATGTSNVPLKAHVVMMCGCPITEGGLWDSADVEVKAMVYMDGDLKKVIPMVWKSSNIFEGQLPVSESGLYEIMVYAYSARTGNTGLDKVVVTANLN